MDTRELAEQFNASARHFQACPLYEHMLHVAAGNDDVLRIVAHTLKGPQPTNLLLAAIHFLLLRDPDQELAQWYESIVESPRSVEGVDEAFVSFCLEHETELINLLQNRLMQTNEVARAIPLRAGLAFLARELDVPQPCDYMEIGASAGLLMAFEGYRYEVGQRVVGNENSQLTLSTTWEGDPLPLKPLPKLRSIRGIDVHPVDLGDPDERLWLHALVWPNAHHRREQLSGAFAEVEDREIQVESMDVNTWVERLLREQSQETPLIVFHAAVHAHMPRVDWDKFIDGLVHLAHKRPVYRISMESDSADRAGMRDRSPFLLEVQHVPEPPRALAALDGHVTWIAPL